MTERTFKFKSKKRIEYINRTSIKLWNFYDDNIVAYFKKRFSSYLSELGLSWHPFMHPKNYIQVKNQQTTKNDFFIYIFHEKRIEDRLLTFDLNHLLFFDIVDKDQEFRVLNRFNEILKTKNELNEKLKINENHPYFFLNPSFFLILYDSTNEMENFQTPELYSISIPSYSDLIITEQMHFESQGFYEWLYKTTYRTSRVIRTDINPEVIKYFQEVQDRHEKSPFYEVNKTMEQIIKYECDILSNRNEKSQLFLILERFSMDDLKMMGKKLNLTEISTGKNQLINNLTELSAQMDIRDSIIRICKENLQKKVITIRSENKEYLTQLKLEIKSKYKNLFEENKFIHKKNNGD